ncbi:MAG: prephenate dehydrogenase dimerization domain-containing protein, partial [Pseudomonadota bacterium]
LLEELTDRGHQGLILDVASIKSPLIEPLRQAAAAGLNICSVHPMFGPDTRLLSGRHVRFMDVGNEVAVGQAEALFTQTMAEIKRIDIEQHDRLIAWVLGLSHAVNIAFFAAVTQSGLSANELSEVSSTTFNRQLAIARDVAAENPDLYFEIQQLNEQGGEPREALLDVMKIITESVEQGDLGTFRSLMLDGRAYLSDL